MDSRIYREQGVDDEWVSNTVLINKTLLKFMAKSWWVEVRSRLCPTMADNNLTLDRALMVACIMAGFDIDFSL